MPFAAQPTEKCVACGRTVYATERTVVEEISEKKVYHKACIRCQTCNKVLSVGQYSAMDGKFWCKPHFKQLFASKGNYDEPFGKEKRRDSVAATTPPTSFIPEVKSDSKSEKKQTSEETLAKFRKFREEGDTDKCTVCSKTVYLAEKLIVEDKDDKRTFHKTCFKCSVCELKLDLRNYGSVDGKLFCKNHLKEQSKINAPSGAVVAPASFIPEVEKSNTQNSKETPEHIASKFKGLSNTTDKCKACGKSVYATEKSVLTEGFGKQVTYHKQCLKCSICSVKLDVSNYGISNGILFCHVHLKQYGKPEQAKSDNAYFVSPLASADPSYTPGPKDGDIPNQSNDDRDDRSSNNNNIRDSRDSDSYERSNSNDRDLSASQQEEIQQQEQDQDHPTPERSSTPELTKQDSAQSSPQVERIRSRSISESTEDDSKKKDDERQRKREERVRQQQEEEKREEEEREKRRQAREQRLKEISTSNEESTSTSTGSEDPDRSKREAEREERRRKREEERKKEEEDREREEAKRKREREERKRQQDELAARELEEQERKAEERRKKLEELKSSS